jgi:hypothetical protein
MAHFIGYVHGSRGEASRLGTKATGIQATGQGWNVGGKVITYYNSTFKCDVVTFWLNAGSSGGQPTKMIGSYVAHPDTGALVELTDNIKDKLLALVEANDNG